MDSESLLQDITLSFEELNQMIEEKRALIKARDEEYEIRKKVLLKLKEDKLAFDEKFLKKSSEYKMCVEGSKEFNDQLMKLQSKYNTVVDPYNKMRITIGKNKEKDHEIASKCAEKSKKIEDRKDQMSHKICSMNSKIEEIRQKIKKIENPLTSAKGILEKKREELKEAQANRQTLAFELNSVCVEDLKTNLETAKLKKEEENQELEDVRIMRNQTEKTIKELNEKKAQGYDMLKFVEEEIIEKNEELSIKQQRLANENQIAEKILTAKLKRQAQKIEEANINIAKGIRDGLDKIVERETLEEEMKQAIQDNVIKIAALKAKKVEKLKRIDEMNAKDFAEDPELKKKESLVEIIENIQQKKQQEIEDHEKTLKHYNEQIKKEKHKQTLLGALDSSDEASLVGDDNRANMSEVSSSMSLKSLVAEKIDFEVSMMESSIVATSSKIPNKSP